MIEAVVKNKIPEIRNQENFLTSTVWGLLKYQPMRPILANFISRATLYTNNNIRLDSIIPITRFMDDALSIDFWKYVPPYGEPDIIIVGYDFAFVVEIKYDANISGKDQLKRYYDLLKHNYPTKSQKHIIYLTRDLTCPELDREVTAGLDNSLWWLSWYDLNKAISTSSGDSAIAKEICVDIVSILTHYNLQLFQGISLPLIASIKNYFWEDVVPIFTDYECVSGISKFFWLEEKA